MPLYRIVADEAIPMIRELFRRFGEITLLPGPRIDRHDVKEADVLLVRSVTRVDGSLLAGSRVRFVGSATAGMDHVDHAYLRRGNVCCANAPGSNAVSVVEYVIAALLRLAVRKADVLRGKTVGIVGCGQVGGRLAARLPHFGCRILANDPPLALRAEQEGRPHVFRPLDEVLAESDVVSLHVPLVHGGPHQTLHLIDADRLAAMKSGAWLIDTSRGGIVDHAALRRVLESRSRALGAVVLDVWEHEPLPDPWLVAHVDLATPHVAGYSYDAKITGSLMLFEAFVEFARCDGSVVETVLHSTAPHTAETVSTAQQAGGSGHAAFFHRGAVPIHGDTLPLTPPDPALPEVDWLDSLVVQMCDVAADAARMREMEGGDAAFFHNLRKTYHARRTFSAYALGRTFVPEDYRFVVRKGLGVVVAG